ncbi:hypothetical protein [Scytonema sp. PCC 10023]|uniref:hypothetical protein n=1 Tax=Scytonema sp. PCC 10023 TaxID=1680591 RepID=UPI0039C5CE0C
MAMRKSPLRDDAERPPSCDRTRLQQQSRGAVAPFVGDTLRCPLQQSPLWLRTKFEVE